MTTPSDISPAPHAPGPLPARRRGRRQPLVRTPELAPRVRLNAAGRPRRSFATLRTIWALMLREMATTYGRSPGGYIWAVAEPALGITLLTVIFSVILRNPPLGVSFPLYYATGMLPFLLFSSISNNTSRALTFSRQLLAYPAVTFADAILARFLLTLLTQLMVTYVVLLSIFALFETRVILNFEVIAEALLLTAFLGLGIGVLNSLLLLVLPVWASIWSILTRPLFLISGVLFLYDQIPLAYRGYLWWNPLIHPIGLMRRGVYIDYDAHYVSIPYVLGVSGLCLLIGLVLLKRHYRTLLDKN